MQQVVLRPLQHALAEHVVGDSADHQDHAAVINTPSPGTARPSSRTDTGSVTPSTTWKIHTSAATLMISGTVTKKPGDETPPEPRTCDSPRHRARPPSSPRARTDSRQTRPGNDWPDNAGNNLIVRYPTTPETTRPTANSVTGNAGDADLRQIQDLFRRRGQHRRQAHEEHEPRRRLARRNPSEHAPASASRPIARCPGTSAAACATPIANASPVADVASSRVCDPARSATSSPTPPSASVTATTRRRTHRCRSRSPNSQRRRSRSAPSRRRPAAPAARPVRRARISAPGSRGNHRHDIATEVHRPRPATFRRGTRRRTPGRSGPASQPKNARARIR